MRTNVSRALRVLRRRRGWRQVDLARRAGLSRDVVLRAENEEIRGITVGSLDRLVSELDAQLVVEIRWRGADLDRLIDARHAAIAGSAARRLEGSGWRVYPEVSFNHFGDRGRCDLVAWHATTGTLLIVEVKSRVGDLQDMLGQLDVKRRLGSVIARELGLDPPAGVVRTLVLAEDGANRRTLLRHEALFRTFALRGREAFGWLRRPDRPASGLLWFESPDVG
jgi:transcriptional regulator with XRE-family HTH domain